MTFGDVDTSSDICEASEQKSNEKTGKFLINNNNKQRNRTNSFKS